MQKQVNRIMIIMQVEKDQLKVAKDYDFIEYVESKIINEKYSPDAVIMELKHNGFINPKLE